jgi:hypothetical protein
MAERVIEVITGRERHRQWSIEEKRRIVGETFEPGRRSVRLPRGTRYIRACCSRGGDSSGTENSRWRTSRCSCRLRHGFTISRSHRQGSSSQNVGTRVRSRLH